MSHIISFFYPKHGGRKFFRNVGTYLPNRTMSH